ncbi:hypothetical protein ABT039_25720 [Streptomyces lasiicapitis]|uniref:hypothetical protein n=1 Tax=Streptomyces TaxID=1883 RepID=UPI0013DAD698|nr:hypothetical protein [Streptomyces aureoverticillatus]QIB47796.1 hypothetical protein G3H79_36710 [Streptomyces aureoverticillatus]
MTYDQERAQQPQGGRPDLVEQHASQTPRTEAARAPREPVASADASVRTPGSTLLAQGERDKLTIRLQQALNAFVESPRQAVEEADGVFDEVVTQLTENLAERRRALRAGWQGQDTEAQTEELRLALRQYKETTELLLRM